MNEILAGFMNALQPLNLAAMAVSVAIGIMIGALPGLSAAMGVALLIPITFGMPASTGLIVLAGVYCGAIFGGSISAILIHTPGTPASAATAIDGYQLTLKGKAGKALGTAIISSFFGGLLSCISLYFFAPALAKLAMAFGSPEIFLAVHLWPDDYCGRQHGLSAERSDFRGAGPAALHGWNGPDERRVPLHLRPGRPV